jgi:putative transposase
MARLPRVVVVDVPHHVTQRGNARQVILANDADRITYVELLRQNSELHRLSLWGYCLMSNHVHLIAVPRTDEALAQTLKHTHGRYAAYWNARQSSSGHVWQGRFYSCPLDDSHLWEALRYVELNPVRAGLIATAEQWRWSSAAAHSTLAVPESRFGNGAVAEKVDGPPVARVFERERVASQSHCFAPVHSYRPAAGDA